MCTHCRRKENGTVKNLKISTLPPVLIIHLKRFCQTKISNSKLNYPVQFPLINLNVKRFLSTNANLTVHKLSFCDEDTLFCPNSLINPNIRAFVSSLICGNDMFWSIVDCSKI